MQREMQREWLKKPINICIIKLMYFRKNIIDVGFIMSTKLSVSIDKCQPGMKVAETVFNSYGGIIVSQDSILDQHTIRKLHGLNISKIKIFKMNDIKIKENNKSFKVQYNTQIENVKDVIKDISSGKNLEMDRINHIVDSIAGSVKENRDIVSCINEVRDVDEYTYTHCMNVSLLAMMIGKWLKLDQNKVKDLAYAGVLHDLGKTKIDPAILNKPGKLTDEEYEEIKKHSVYGYRLLENIPEISKSIALGVLMHHEREDGTGYTLKASSDQIHEYGKIVAVADVYDAMTSNRVYRAKQCPFEVFESIENGTFGKLDQRITSTFLNCIANYYVGDLCKLSTGEQAEITYIHPIYIARPLIRVDNVYIDLSKETDIKIVEML